MPEDLKLSQIGSSQLTPPFRGLHSPGVRKHCQIIFACYFRKSSINETLKWLKALHTLTPKSFIFCFLFVCQYQYCIVFLTTENGETAPCEQRFRRL